MPPVVEIPPGVDLDRFRPLSGDERSSARADLGWPQDGPLVVSVSRLVPRKGMDVLIDSAEIHAPDRVCREIFQIYREALNNIKKHAKASHVVVKLSQDDSALVLVVDDNGEGFSFAGRFTGDELDRLRLGPISIKERARTVGGILTVESNPGHGARLIIEIPLG